MQETLYEYAVLWQPTKEQREKGSKAKLICSPRTLLAFNENQVLLSAAANIAEEYKSQLDQIEVIVRPF